MAEVVTIGLDIAIGFSGAWHRCRWRRCLAPAGSSGAFGNETTILRVPTGASLESARQHFGKGDAFSMQNFSTSIETQNVRRPLKGAEHNHANRPSARRCAAVSLPLPVRSSQQTVLLSSTRNSRVLRGDTLTREFAVADATKKIC